MKAKLSLTKQQEREVQRRVSLIVQRELSKETNALTRRVVKLLFCILHEEFGFGKQRLVTVVDKLQELLKVGEEDEIFWEHLDRLLIDRLGLELERDYTENRRPVRYEDDRTN